MRSAFAAIYCYSPDLELDYIVAITEGVNCDVVAMVYK
jgi:hypothetical protein